MSARIDAFDWAGTSVGPRSNWPSTLRTMVDVMLLSRFPMLIFWGRDFVQIYNDAYIALLGANHPNALGQTAEACWPEIWETVGTLLRGVVDTGEATWAEDYMFMLERNGYPEECYFTFSYSPFGSGAAHGVLCTNVETTRSVLRERDFRMMANTVADIVYTHGPGGTVDWANARWYEYSKLPPELALDPAGWQKLYPAEDFARLLSVLETAFATGEAYEVDVRIKPYGQSDDALRWFLLRAVPMRADDGTIVKWAGSGTDVHDRRVAEQTLREQLERDLHRERQTSVAFQNAALPQQLPRLPGVSLSAIYEAAGSDARVGGDWYDAFRLADGRVVLSVGDVIGNGLRAAVTMAAARQAIRGAAQVYPEPSAVLDAADRALRSEQPDRIVTAFLGIFDPITLKLTYASAGHPPPLVRGPGGDVRELDGADLPLGLRNERPTERDRSTTLPEDALLVLYTDGLTEATRDPQAGEARLRDLLRSDAIFRSDSPAAAIRDAMFESANDDVAILAIRVGRFAGGITRFSVRANDAASSTHVRRAVTVLLRRAGATDAEADDAELVVGELLGNVVRHTGGEAEVVLDLNGPEPVVHVLDRGPGFTFYARLPSDRFSESGRGLFLLKSLARDISVVPRNSGGSHARAVLAMRSARRSPA